MMAKKPVISKSKQKRLTVERIWQDNKRLRTKIDEMVVDIAVLKAKVFGPPTLVNLTEGNESPADPKGIVESEGSIAAKGV